MHIYIYMYVYVYIYIHICIYMYKSSHGKMGQIHFRSSARPSCCRLFKRFIPELGGSRNQQNHRKTIGKWWLHGILWVLHDFTIFTHLCYSATVLQYILYILRWVKGKFWDTPHLPGYLPGKSMGICLENPWSVLLDSKARSLIFTESGTAKRERCPSARGPNLGDRYPLVISHGYGKNTILNG